MLRLAEISLSGRRVVTIESDYDTAAGMAAEVERSGGILVGAVPGIVAANALLGNGLAMDCAMMTASLAADADRSAIESLRRHGVEMVFVTGFDEWFEADAVEEVFELYAATA